MTRPVRGLRVAALGLVAVILVAASPATSRAVWLGYRNDTKTPVIVQVASVQRNIVRRGAQHQLYTGDVAWDCILQPGVQIITVVDANDSKRVLYQDRLLLGRVDLFFSFQLKAPPPPRKGERPPPPRYELVPTNPPSPPPGARR